MKLEYVLKMLMERFRAEGIVFALSGGLGLSKDALRAMQRLEGNYEEG